MALVKSTTPLHMVNEREYKKQEGNALEERKKKLQEIRGFYKPIDREAMQKHQRDYSTTKKEKEALVRQNREKSIQD